MSSVTKMTEGQNETRSGIALHPSDIEGIQEFILQSMTNFSPVDVNNPDVLANLDWRTVIADLVSHINRISHVEQSP